MTFAPPMLRWIAGAADEIFPRQHKADAVAALRRGWRFDTPADYCFRCGSSVASTAVTRAGCPFCVGRRLPWNRMVRLGAYRPPMDQWVVAMKFQGLWRWGELFGKRLAVAMPRGLDPARTVVCPVPMHWWRRCRRGYNQAQVIAGTIARTRGLRVAPLLRRTRYTGPQFRLPRSARAGNIRGSFAGENVDLTGMDIWLVDDIKTTGSTLNACARLIRRMGAREVNVAVAAVADPRGADFTVIQE